MERNKRVGREKKGREEKGKLNPEGFCLTSSLVLGS